MAPTLKSSESGSTRTPTALVPPEGEIEVGAALPVDYAPDGPRYAACGDAVTANVAHWLGLRLLERWPD